MTYSFKTAGWPERLWRTNNDADIARGNVPGSYPYSVFGEFESQNAITDQVLWETGMPRTLTVPNSIQLSVSSTSASDTGTVNIRYLDGDLVERVESVQLNGTTPVLTSATDIRAINNAYYEDGSATIGDVTGSNAGTVYFIIPSGMVQFNTSMIRVPKGKRLMINALYAGSVSGSADARTKVKLETTLENGSSFAEQGVLHPVAAIGLQDNSTTMSGFGPFPIPEGEWVGLTFSSDKGAEVLGGFFGYMEDL